MHILDTRPPCEYLRPGGAPCGRPALHSVGGHAVCTACKAELTRTKVARWKAEQKQCG